MAEKNITSDFEAQALMAHFKFKLTEHTLDGYASMKEILNQQ